MTQRGAAAVSYHEAMARSRAFAAPLVLGLVAAALSASVSCDNGAQPAPDASTMPDTSMPACDDACDEKTPPLVPFDPGPYGTKPKDVAGPFVLPTTDGDWDFQANWTGQDSYVFLIFGPNKVLYPNGADYSADLFKQSLSALLPKSPQNVHYFFLPLSSSDAAWPAARDKWMGQLANIGGDWPPRVHFCDTGALDLTSWIGDMIRYRYQTPLPYKEYDYLQFAIDRFQRIREVGMLAQLVQNGVAAKLEFLGFEPKYYEFEWARDQAMKAAPQATVVSLAKQQTVYDTWDVDVTLPDLSGMDTLEVDLAMDCDNHRDGECGAWDYLSHLWVCSPGDGGPQCDTEIARWITSYWRETRWVTDISQMLALLKQGKAHFRWWATGQFDPRKTNYTVSLDLRFSNRGKGMRPVAATPLWTGGKWDPTYDASHAAQMVNVPSGAKKVELYVLVTGHGAANGNCAEFCDHEHHFSVNGATHDKTFPEASTPLGCTNDVGKGAVPNQHGTWYYGRGGWCPGWDVAPWVVDVTKDAKLGQSNTLGYTTTFGGMPVDQDRGNIDLSSYLVTWQ